jgi:site-specific DNA-methyltransferase (adenine-specific)
MNLLPFDQTNRLHLGDCVDGMRRLPDACIPLTVTSPPYDNLRQYGNHPFDFEAVARELWRVTAPGGVIVWVVQDEIVDGSETGTSCRQQLFFQDLGFRVHNRIVMANAGSRWPGKARYGGSLELALVLTKGKPRTIRLLQDSPNKNVGQLKTFYRRGWDGRLERAGAGSYPVGRWSARGNVWVYPRGYNQSSKDWRDFIHPALMPEAMAEDLILSFSKPGELVFDPFAGAGTTARMAFLNHRRYLGYEVHETYLQRALERLADARAVYRRRLDEWLTGTGGKDRSATDAR